LKVRLGNAHAIEAFRNPGEDALHYRVLKDEQVTEVNLPLGTGLDEAEQTVVGAMAHHLVPGQGPSWVESDDEALQIRLEKYYGIQARNRTLGPLGVLSISLGVLIAAPLLMKMLPLLRTNVGRDWQCRVMGDPTSTGTGFFAPATWIGVTVNNAVPVATETALPGEITVGSLARAQGAFAHTTGTISYTVTKTFTSDQNVTLAKSGLYTAQSGGTMVFTSLLNEPAPVVSGDQLQVTSTITP
jgi:hypothetical protein